MLFDAELAQGSTFQAYMAGSMPDPSILVSEWADAFRLLPQKSSAEPGPWRTSRTPYMREIMDCMSTTSPVEEVVFMAGAQVGKSEALLNVLGYVVDHAPGPTLLVQPTVELAKRFSRQRVEPLFVDTPCLAGKVAEEKSRDHRASMLQKQFRGGVLVITGANSAVGLRSMPARWLLLDEIDGYPVDVDGEGSPVELAEARQRTFARRKRMKCSTPTVAGQSPIEQAYLATDMRRYFVPCPECGGHQTLDFARLQWTKYGRKPIDAVYECLYCEAQIEDHQKTRMMSPESGAEWRATSDEETSHKVRGYHISSLYSPVGWLSWGAIAEKFVKVHKIPEDHRVFVNTVLGETWQERGEAPEWERLYQRRENYQVGTVPSGALMLTAGVDVQKDRLVVEIVAWGAGKTSWSIDYGVLPGDTADLASGPWVQLDELLARTYPSEDGSDMSIKMLAVDSGFNTQSVYSWARKYPMSRVIAVKGQAGGGAILGAPSPVDITARGKRPVYGYKMWPVHGAVAKSELYGFLRLEPPTDEGPYPPGFCHFPEYDDDYFKQLTAEHVVTHRTRGGFMKLEWEMIPGRENHCLDCFDSETEVLTRDGWRRFDVLTGDELLATVNLPTDAIEFQRPERLIARSHSGDMVQLKGRRLDILVTPNHRMVTYEKEFVPDGDRRSRGGPSGRWNFDVAPKVTLAKDLTLHHMLKATATWQGSPVSPGIGEDAAVGDVAEFLGWYVAEGYSTRNVWRGRIRRGPGTPWVTPKTPRVAHVVGVSQMESEKKRRLGDLLRRLPWRWRKQKDRFVTSSKALYEYLHREVGLGAANKRVPQWVKDSPPDVIARFVDGAILGDGWIQGNFRTYATISKQLAGDMQELFLKLGNASNVRVVPARPWTIEGRSGTNARDQYHVSECRTKRQYLVRRGARGVKSQFIGRHVPYSGMVYCATVPNGTLICRRNGRSFIAGNCRIYARAAASLAGMDRWRDPDAVSLKQPAPRLEQPPREPWIGKRRTH